MSRALARSRFSREGGHESRWLGPRGHCQYPISREESLWSLWGHSVLFFRMKKFNQGEREKVIEHVSTAVILLVGRIKSADLC